MNEEAQAGILLALGALALRLGLTDAHLAYVKAVMGPALVISGGVLVVLAGAVLLRPRRVAEEGDESHAAALAGHDETAGHHDHASRVAWLLMAPVLAIAVVSPRPLGAFAANRAPASLPASTADDFGPLPAPSRGAVDLTVKQFVGRAIYGQGRLLAGVPVRLVGFAAPDSRGGGFLLTRFILTCCAADGRPVRVVIRGVNPPYPASDTWLEVVGTWRPEHRAREDERPPILDAREVVPVPTPTDPYLR